ncbi:MAG: hypothetical protein PUP93_28980 [Rhizonema sp. NSF051]|nr:hypothetical protein [Rhizonema sp. NSF051]
MEKLGFNLETWGKTISQWCNEVWSLETEINRKTIFHLINKANSCRHPIYSLAMIWVFEATGVVFIGHTQKAAVALGMDEELYYLGRTHFEEEFGHSVVAQDYADVELEDTLYEQICNMVDELFNGYIVLFDCWYEHRGKYDFAKLLQPVA